jgi:anthranilate synthase component 1
MITAQQFTAWTEQGYNWLPLIAEISGDLETPLSLYLKMANSPYTYLLESGLSGENWGRYSIIGLPSKTRIVIKNHQVTYIQDDKVITDAPLEDPLAYIQSIFDSFRVPKIATLPRFGGGFVGYFGYETIGYIEERLDHTEKSDPLNIPDILLMLSDQLLVYDNLINKIFIIVYADSQQADAYEASLKKIQLIKKQITETSIHIGQAERKSASPDNEFVSNITREDYEAKVRKAQAYFKAGDAMQLILSQRFSAPFNEDPIQFYRTIRQLNPSPYMYFLNLANFYIAGTSPEILVRLDQERITVRPLAGTRPRGKSAEEDKKLEQELLADEKEIAEHLMLIDLGRNDIGRVCQIGSVKVTEQMSVERFSHVMHISSTVEGNVISNRSMTDVIRATFPAGTVSGAPKIRAMEIINELEQEQRAVYGGAVGYLGWNGNMDLAIALRTALIKDKTIYIQTGAGLVADSLPANEWQECINKGRALFVAMQLTEPFTLELNYDPNDR